MLLRAMPSTGKTYDVGVGDTLFIPENVEYELLSKGPDTFKALAGYGIYCCTSLAL